MKLRGNLWVTLGALVVVAASLIAVVGVFWVLEIAPLLFFVGVGLVYGVLSTRPRRSGPERNSATEVPRPQRLTQAGDAK